MLLLLLSLLFFWHFCIRDLASRKQAVKSTRTKRKRVAEGMQNVIIDKMIAQGSLSTAQHGNENDE